MGRKVRGREACSPSKQNGGESPGCAEEEADGGVACSVRHPPRAGGKGGGGEEAEQNGGAQEFLSHKNPRPTLFRMKEIMCEDRGLELKLHHKVDSLGVDLQVLFDLSREV